MGEVYDFPTTRSSGAPREIAAAATSGVDLLIGAEAFPRAMLLLARSFIAEHETSPRVAALFATQQRWLLYHTALACHFRAAASGRRGLTRRAFANVALQHGIASRNTAHAFFDEVLKYDVIRLADDAADGLTGQVVPSPAALSMLIQWYAVHFEALDLVDGGHRAVRFLGHPESMLACMQPGVADVLLSSPEMRIPRPLSATFTWADAGGLLMDRLVVGIGPERLPEQNRYLTDVNAISHLARSSGLSRAHTSRKLSAAESIGCMGWSGRRGHSPIWISRGFYEQYARAQACKLLILNNAFEEASAAIAFASDKHAVAGES
ncbi:hypothetical protein GA0061102_101543 [Rhizobium miluonense]|uniref:Uncharacterized protein n=1 Tax=Rhizobium miluonense TaxID=411945 RepID=A0A1C3VMA7_9HYPH|nr:hypothetical protein GA0061102_101543 [Rhizobium miluonense]